jgi:hypothetical protein
MFIKGHEKEGDKVFVADTDVGDYYLGHETYPIDKFKRSDFSGKNARAWFIEDMTTDELFPERLAWFQENARLVANYDVTVRGRTFKMRVYLYDPAWETLQNGP